MSSFTNPHRPGRKHLRRGLFAASAFSAAIAAMTLTACGPRDEAPLAGGSSALSAPATAATTAQAPTMVATTAPTAGSNQTVTMAPAPVQSQGRPVPTAQGAGAHTAPPAYGTAATAYPAPAYQAPAYPATSPVYPADGPQMQPAQVAVQPQPVPVRPVRVAQAAPSGRIGSIEGIQPIRERPQGSGAGAVIGGVLGAVVGNQFGHGLGRAAMTGVGVAGGAVAGNNIERNYKEGVVGYRVSIRLDNGSSRTFERNSVGDLHVGDRVRVEPSGSFHRV